MTTLAARPYGLVRTVDPTAEPVSDEEARAWLRMDHAGDDPMIASLARAARELVENAAGLAICTQTWRLYLDQFPDVYGGFGEGAYGGCGAIELPRSPLIGVTSITYVDTSGATQTLSASAYEVDETVRPGRVQPAYSQVWPVARRQAKAVTVTFTAGWGAPSAVPEGVKQAIKVLLAHGWANSGALPAQLPAAAWALLGPFAPGVYP